MRVFITARPVGSAPRRSELIGAGHQVVGWRVPTSRLPPSPPPGRRCSAALSMISMACAARLPRRMVYPPRVQARHRLLGWFQEAADADRRAVETFGEALAGSDRPFVVASGPSASHRAVGDRTDGMAAMPWRPLGPRHADPARHGRAGARPGIARRPLVHHPALADESRRRRSRLPGELVGIAATRASPATSGRVSRWPPCTGSIPRISSASRWRGLRRGRHCTRSLTRGADARHRRGHRPAPAVPVGSIAPEDAAAHFAWLAPMSRSTAGLERADPRAARMAAGAARLIETSTRALLPQPIGVTSRPEGEGCEGHQRPGGPRLNGNAGECQPDADEAGHEEPTHHSPPTANNRGRSRSTALPGC